MIVEIDEISVFSGILSLMRQVGCVVDRGTLTNAALMLRQFLTRRNTAKLTRAHLSPTKNVKVLAPLLFSTNCTNFTIGEKFQNFTELYNGHGTLWNFYEF